MSGIPANAPLSVRNVLLALGELDRAAPGTLPPFATDLAEQDRFVDTLGGILGRIKGEQTPGSVRDRMLRTLEYTLSRDGLPDAFAKMAVDSLRGADTATAGVLRNRIQHGFEAMARGLEAVEPARAAHAAASRRIGGVPAGSDFGALGWQRIGTSSFWRQGETVGMAKPGVCPTIMSAYRVAREARLTGLKVTERDAFFRVTPEKPRDSGLRTMHLGGGTTSVNHFMMDDQRVHLEQHFEGLDAVGSLRASGFQEVAPGAYELTVAGDHERHDLLALVENGRIVELHKSEVRRTDPMLRGGQFRIVDVVPNKFDPDEKNCVVENTLLGLRFTVRGSFLGDSSLLRPLESYAPADLGILAPYLAHAESSGFIVGGVNSSATIRACTSFNGHDVAFIEDLMRPSSPDTTRSQDGFLQAHQSLVDEMAFQNDFVLSRGSTHQEVARHLRQLQAAYRFGSDEIDYHGTTFVLEGHPAMGGAQDSPFKDGSGGGGGFYLSVKARPHERVLVSPTAIDMIERWGFYEGRGCEWHVSPQKLFKMLHSALS